MTLSAGESTAANDREATRLARVQRAHMKRPTPYPPKERDDIVVPLENPAIELPIYWLGRSFDPGGPRLDRRRHALSARADSRGPFGHHPSTTAEVPAESRRREQLLLHDQGKVRRGPTHPDQGPLLRWAPLLPSTTPAGRRTLRLHPPRLNSRRKRSIRIQGIPGRRLKRSKLVAGRGWEPGSPLECRLAQTFSRSSGDGAPPDLRCSRPRRAHLLSRARTALSPAEIG
jgi:hypothetical protein